MHIILEILRCVWNDVSHVHQADIPYCPLPQPAESTLKAIHLALALTCVPQDCRPPPTGRSLIHSWKEKQDREVTWASLLLKKQFSCWWFEMPWDPHGISNLQQLNCFFYSLFRLTTKNWPHQNFALQSPLWEESISNYWIPWLPALQTSYQQLCESLESFLSHLDWEYPVARWDKLTNGVATKWPPYRWLSARKTQLQCVSNGVTSFLH